MGLFKRGEVVDLTEWKKRGLLDVPMEEPLPAPIDNQGMLDFTARALPVEPTSEAVVMPSLPVATPSEAAPNFDFLDNPQPTVLSQSTSPLTSSTSVPELNELKIKLDDTMFKLDLLLDKIAKIENRLGLNGLG